MTKNRKTEKILVVSTSWLGDAIITLPTLQGLRTLFPEAHIAILAKDTIADIFKTVDTVDEIIPFQKGKGLRKVRRILKTAALLGKKKFDRAIIFPRSLGSALTCFLARIPKRIGFAANGRSLLLTEAIERDSEILSKHQVHYYKKLLKTMGTPVCPELPSIQVPEKNRSWARDFLGGNRDASRPFLVGINPGATYGEAKQWLPERYGALAKRLFQNSGCDIIIFGDQQSGPLAEKINRGLENRGIDVTGKTDILQLAALLRACDLLVTNDTGPMHVACALETPVVAIYGSTNPKTTSPLGPDAVMVKKDLPCSPCMQRICPEGHHLCMKNVSVDEVEQAVLKKLGCKGQ